MPTEQTRCSKQKRLLVFLSLLIAPTLSACSQSITLYPIQGPLAAQRPLPVISAKADGILGNTGDLSLSLPSGENCTGKWSSAAPQMVATSTLMTQYGGVAGYAVTSGPAPGVNRGEAFVSCNQGTTMQVEFYTGSGTANGYGLAKDSLGNVYKLIF